MNPAHTAALAAGMPLAAVSALWVVFAAGSSALVAGLAARAGRRLSRRPSEPAEDPRSPQPSGPGLGDQRALLEAIEALTGELRLDAVPERLVMHTARLLGVEAADCYLRDERRDMLRCAAVHGFDDALVGFEFPVMSGDAARAIADGRPVVTNHYDALADPVPHPAYAGFAAAVVAPMTWGETTRGVLGVGTRDRSRRFTEADADVVQTLASTGSLALRNAESFEQSARQAQIQRGFFRIASVLGEPLSLAETLDAVAQAATEALGGAFSTVVVSRRGERELIGSHALPPALADRLANGVPAAGAAFEAAVRDGRLVAAPDVASDERFDPELRRLAVEAGCRSLLAIPIDVPRAELRGAVAVCFDEERSFSDDDVALAGHLADAARGAVERSELFERERRSRSLAQELARSGRLLASELDPATVLDDVVRQAPALLGVGASSIRILEGDELVLAAATGEGAAAVVGARTPSTGWLLGDIVHSRLPRALSDVRGDERLARADPLLERNAAFVGVPLLGPDDGLHGVLCVYDETPRDWRDEEVEALQALAGNAAAALASAELYQRVALEKERSFAILANIADGIVAVDRDGKVVLWNAAAEQITGVPAEEAVGARPEQALRTTLESGGDAPAGDRLVPIRRGDDEVWLSVTEAIMRAPAGAVAGRIYAFRDISADRLVEQMKSDFVSTVSHELRTPLTSIYGFAETLLRQDVRFGDEERATFLGYIASESARLTDIVDDLLNVARLDTGDLQVQLAPTDVGGVVSDVVASARSASLDGHRFVVDVPDEPLAAHADADKLRQIVAKLVDNAVKYSPSGGTVTVSARRKDGAVEIRVDDEGIGIPRGEQERIFRKFYRAETATGGRGAGGTGLGLFIARELVAKMGGRISVTSAEGRGSTFSFELPLARQPWQPRTNDFR